MTDVTTSDDNCVDGFTGELDCSLGVLDDDSNTRHFVFKNRNPCSLNETNESIERNEGTREIDSDISDCDEAYRMKTKRRKRVLLKNEILDLRCRWSECEFQHESLDTFVGHVKSHITDIPVRVTDEDGTESYSCLWQSCSFVSNIIDEIKCHVNFHSYHTKLKCLGANIKTRINLPNCLYKGGETNQMNNLEYPHKCCWIDCTYKSLNIQNFINHVYMHINESASTENYQCQWNKCTNNFVNMNKLSFHIRVHTKEKLVACPDCGGMFASNTKFIDHCKRQMLVQMSGFECAHCFKLYSSERILRDHMRSHINIVKCIYCDMTCANKYTLATHMRYRHIKAKPFQCPSCNYKCETKQDFDNHLHVHDAKYRLSCDEADCDFTCRSQNALKKHILHHHEGVPYRIYECHECGKQYLQGVLLTYHLMARHNLHWPSGHKRFSYRPDEDGKYRLQQIRYESLEDTEQNAPIKPYVSDDDTTEGVTSPRQNEPLDNGVLITIDEDNECGKRIAVSISSIKPVESLPHGAFIIAEGQS